MKLGILVNTDRHLEEVIGITRAALSKGHTVSLLCMDAGTRFLAEPSFARLCGLEGVKVSFCQHSAEEIGAQIDDLPREIVVGSQYDNALMNHESDKVIVL